MSPLTSTFLDSSLAFQVAPNPPVTCLPFSRFSRVLALAPSSFGDNLQLAKSGEQDSPFKPKPSWWIPFLPGAPDEWFELFKDDSVSPSFDDDSYILHANTAYVRPRSEAAVKASPKKSGRRKVVFTPEMARKLRKQMKKDDSFHDFMYHSAIATRLATHES